MVKICLMGTEELNRKLRKIKVLILDVDGVLTDGTIIYDGSGQELKAFNVRDGAAIKWLQRAGIEVAIISGRNSPPVLVRAKELGIEKLVQGALDKLPAFEKFLDENGRQPEETAFIGDDVHDLPILKRAGFSACPADAVDEVKNMVDYVCQARGGRGAVREVAELILKGQKKWNEALKKYQV